MVCVVSGVLGMWWLSWAEVIQNLPAPSLTTDAPEAMRLPAHGGREGKVGLNVQMCGGVNVSCWAVFICEEFVVYIR